ncbi:hypothetical protein [Ramlibacter sp. PS4R-6]|uniref:hypothetical protein n=1 Tax=Ramlibacter sp. PS4R-6 TaxID=3133438 RepID=UPI0030AFA651
MQDWLGHPAVQGGILPFIAALAVAAPLARTRWLALAQVAGFAACATLAIGWSLESLPSTRRLALVAVASLALCVLVEQVRTRSARILVVAVLAASSAWVLWRLLAQKELAAAAGAGLVIAAYVAWQAAATLRVSADPVRGAAAAAALGFGTGVVAILGASALLGVSGLAAGSAAAATLCVQALRGRPAPDGRSVSLPATVAASLVGVAAVMTAELPWYVLIPLLAVAPAAMLATPAGARWRASLAFPLSLVPALAAVALAWYRPL